MKILMAHNYYQQAGGEDRSFAAEVRALETHGHTVVQYTVHNDVIDGMNRLELVARTHWNRQTYRELRALFASDTFDVAHFQNTFPLISPSAYYAAQDAGVPVVQSIRNYRLFCPSAIFFRDGHVCEDCMGKAVPWPGVLHGCYRESRAQSAVVASMLTLHRALRTWHMKVDRFIALTEFVRAKLIEAGLSPEKIAVKPNALEYDPGVDNNSARAYMVFIGRLTPEKGVHTLLEAWKTLPEIPLKVVGDGPLLAELRAQAEAESLSNVEFTGHLTLEQTIRVLQGARCLILPSEWYETFGRVAVEAFSCAVPVIASRLGAVAEVVSDGETGLHFTPGDAADLATKADLMWRNDGMLSQMSRRAREVFESEFTLERNYRNLMLIYQSVIRNPMTEMVPERVQ